MAKIDFIDEVKIYVQSGKGGAGSSHFRRARFLPNGGPDGGNGGQGGHVILQGNRSVRTLLAFHYRKHLIAPNGESGGPNQRAGANADNLVLAVPLGTVIKTESGQIKKEILHHGETYLAACGGRGGKGNAHFKSATNQAPTKVQLGSPGESSTLFLELKLLADVGLVGQPNAGKSTLLSVVSAAKPKIANYPFTTLAPSVGVVQVSPQRTFVMADLPGLIRGAAQGKGMGIRFLKHIERTKVLLFVLAADEEDILATYTMLQKELQAYKQNILAKKSLVAISKIDLVSDEVVERLVASVATTAACVPISSFSKKGLACLKRSLYTLVKISGE